MNWFMFDTSLFSWDFSGDNLIAKIEVFCEALITIGLKEFENRSGS